MILTADYVFPTSIFSMQADGQKVAEFDVQIFGDAGQWPVVATTGNGKTTWSVYSKGPELYSAMREESSDGSMETYRSNGSSFEGTPCFPVSLQDGQRWTSTDHGVATYTSPTGIVEKGVFTYKNSVWASREGLYFPGASVPHKVQDLLYWLEDYEERYGLVTTRYLRLHIYERGKGLVAYVDHAWADGTKWVTRE